MSTICQYVIFFAIYFKIIAGRFLHNIHAVFIPTFQSEPEKPTFDLSDASDAEFGRLEWIHGFKPHILTEAPALRRLIANNTEK